MIMVIAGVLGIAVGYWLAGLGFEKRERKPEPQPKRDELPVALLIVRADRDARADLTRALGRDHGRWN